MRKLMQKKVAISLAGALLFGMALLTWFAPSPSDTGNTGDTKSVVEILTDDGLFHEYPLVRTNEGVVRYIMRPENVILNQYGGWMARGEASPDWRQYRNDDFDIEFRYPPEVTVMTDVSNADRLELSLVLTNEYDRNELIYKGRAGVLSLEFARHDNSLWQMENIRTMAHFIGSYEMQHIDGRTATLLREEVPIYGADDEFTFPLTVFIPFEGEYVKFSYPTNNYPDKPRDARIFFGILGTLHLDEDGLFRKPSEGSETYRLTDGDPRFCKSGDPVHQQTLEVRQGNVWKEVYRGTVDQEDLEWTCPDAFRFINDVRVSDAGRHVSFMEWQRVQLLDVSTGKDALNPDMSPREIVWSPDKRNAVILSRRNDYDNRGVSGLYATEYDDIGHQYVFFPLSDIGVPHGTSGVDGFRFSDNETVSFALLRSNESGSRISQRDYYEYDLKEKKLNLIRTENY